jgi:hypothetical protein
MHQRRVALGVSAILLVGVALATTRTIDARSVVVDAADGPGAGRAPGTTGTSPVGTSPVGTSPVGTSPVGPSPAGTTPTSSTEPSPPGSLTATTPFTPVTPPIASLELDGTYDGTEHYSLSSAQCSQLTHHLDATISMGPGAPWTYVADYCGETTADGGWRGEGTVVMTGPAGEVLHGRFRDAVPAGSAGEPYTVTIVSGEGAMAGATGACDLTVAVTKIDFGVQGQSGSIRCSITAPGS